MGKFICFAGYEPYTYTMIFYLISFAESIGLDDHNTEPGEIWREPEAGGVFWGWASAFRWQFWGQKQHQLPRPFCVNWWCWWFPKIAYVPANNWDGNSVAVHVTGMSQGRITRTECEIKLLTAQAAPFPGTWNQQVDANPAEVQHQAGTKPHHWNKWHHIGHPAEYATLDVLPSDNPNALVIPSGGLLQGAPVATAGGKDGTTSGPRTSGPLRDGQMGAS